MCIEEWSQVQNPTMKVLNNVPYFGIQVNYTLAILFPEQDHGANLYHPDSRPEVRAHEEGATQSKAHKQGDWGLGFRDFQGQGVLEKQLGPMSRTPWRID